MEPRSAHLAPRTGARGGRGTALSRGDHPPRGTIPQGEVGLAEWFERWFNEDYLALYPHRNEEEARQVTALLTRSLPWRPGWRVLDVGCGAGRHARALADAGARPVGLDLSMVLLRRALAAGVPLVRADMRRLPVRQASIDLAVNLFTSFGYFDRDEEHLGVLREIAECLKPGGWFAIDFLNADTVRDGLVPEEVQELGGRKVRIRRELAEGGGRVVKTIELSDGRRFVERVRLFGPEELAAMLESAGLAVSARFGDYAGGPLQRGSPRALLLASRAA